MDISKKISVIMGIYNCEDTLSDAIESILNQTYTNWELIMCDDCSTDSTYQKAKAYCEMYPEKIFLVQNEKNSKLAYSLNHCLMHATGEYIARMDGDDKSSPFRFEKQVEYLENNPECDLVGCAMQRFNEEGLGDILFAVDNPNYYTLKNKMPFHHATILCRKKVYDELNGYTVAERTNRSQDYDLWFRFYHHGFRGDNLKEVLYYVREDAAAIRRRTAKSRILGLQTTFIGYKLLGYPKSWLVSEVLKTFVKSCIPFFAVDLYRKYQMKKNKKS